MTTIQRTFLFWFLWLALLVLNGCSVVGQNKADSVRSFSLPEEATTATVVDFGSVRFRLPWQTSSWKHWPPYAFRARIPAISAQVFSVNAYAGREPSSEEYYDLVSGVLHGGEACPLEDSQRLRLRECHFGDSIVYEFGDADKRGLIYEKPKDTFIVMVFSVHTADGLQFTIKPEDRKDAALCLRMVGRLAAAVEFPNHGKPLTPDEFRARVLTLDASSRASEKQEKRIEQSHATDG